MKFDRLQVTSMFVNAVDFCDYKDIETVKPEDNVICAYELFDEDVANCFICLFEEDKEYFIAVTHSFYTYYAQLKDVDELLLSYFIRNATKPVDDYEESIAFFAKFFIEFAKYNDVDEFSFAASNAVEQSVDLSYVDIKTYLALTTKRGASA